MRTIGLDFVDLTNKPEAAFAIQCLRQELLGEKVIGAVPERLDWNRFCQFLATNRLSAHFSTFPIFSAKAVPAEFKATLRESRYALLLYGDANIQRIHVLLQALRAADIATIVLKGWIYIYSIYGGDYGQRYYEDIDILVPLQDRAKAQEILCQFEYTPAAESWPGYAFRFNGVQAYFSHKKTQFDRSFVVGLHWGLINTPAYIPEQIDIDGLFSRAVPARVADVDVLQLCLEDQIVYACAHLGYHHGYDQALYRYFEIAFLISRTSQTIDWNVVCGRAKEWKCVLPLQNVLSQIEVLWPGIIDKGRIEQVEALISSSEERKRHDRSLRLGKNFAFKTLLGWVSLPNKKGRLAMALQDIFPSREYMWFRYGAVRPAWLWPVLYLKRFYHSFRFAVNRSFSSAELK